MSYDWWCWVSTMRPHRFYLALTQVIVQKNSIVPPNKYSATKFLVKPCTDLTLNWLYYLEQSELEIHLGVGHDASWSLKPFQIFNLRRLLESITVRGSAFQQTKISSRPSMFSHSHHSFLLQLVLCIGKFYFSVIILVVLVNEILISDFGLEDGDLAEVDSKYY